MSKCTILNPDLCYTCPFRPGVARKYRELRPALELSAIAEAARICHSTGEDNLFHKETGNPERLCAGAHAVRLKVWTATGFLKEATTEAWNERCVEMGLTPLETAPVAVRRPRTKDQSRTAH